MEALVGPANAAVTLAKVDMNDPSCSLWPASLPLRALPALVLFHQGRPDEQAILEGPQDEATLRQYFAAFAPKRSCCSIRQSRRWRTGKTDVAHTHLGQAHRLAPERHADITLWLIQAALDLNLLDEARRACFRPSPWWHRMIITRP